MNSLEELIAFERANKIKARFEDGRVWEGIELSADYASGLKEVFKGLGQLFGEEKALATKRFFKEYLEENEEDFMEDICKLANDYIETGRIDPSELADKIAQNELYEPVEYVLNDVVYYYVMENYSDEPNVEAEQLSDYLASVM
jgi:hypothetical protein